MNEMKKQNNESSFSLWIFFIILVYAFIALLVAMPEIYVAVKMAEGCEIEAEGMPGWDSKYTATNCPER